MAKIKNINTRIQLKNDTEAHWNAAGPKPNTDGFIPLLGEAIVYMGESGHGPRIKIGDGVTNVVDLPFLEDNDTVYTASDGIKITAENVIQHINHLDAFPSEIGFYKIKYDGQGHINGATTVSKQDILDLLQMTPGKINSVQITATAPLISSNSAINTTNLTTDISFSSQEKNKVFAGPTQSASGSPSFRLLIADDIPNLPASKITEGTFSASRIDNLPASKITSGTFNKDRIPNLGPDKISGVIPVDKGGTGVNGISGDPKNNVTSFFDNGVFAYDSGNARFKQFKITTLGNADTFTSYINSLNGDTANRIVDLDTLISAIPPMNLNNPRDIAENYTNSYYAPKTKGWKNSVLISQGGENNNEGTEPIWLNPTTLSTEEHPGGALFYGRDNSSESSPKPFKTQWGTLPVEQGGTGTTTFIADYVLIGSGKNAIRTIAKAYSSTPNTIVERNSNGDFATRAITLFKGLLCNGINNNFLDNLIIDIDSSTKIATFYGNINANNLNAVIGELNMSKTNSETLDQPSIKWYKGSSTKSESAIISQTSTLIGELYWDNNKANRGMLRNYYSSTNGETHSDSYYLPAVNASSANNNEFTFLATADSISGMFPTNSILYSNGNVNKITYKNSANGALYSTSTNGSLEWGILPVAQGGTGLTTSGTVNAVIIGSSIETEKTQKFQTIQSNNGAFYADGINKKPQFGILPVAQGGTGVTSIENIQAGKDGNGNNIISTYQTKVLSGIRDFDIDNPTQNIVQIWNDVSGTNPSNVLGGNQWLVLTDIVNNDSYSGQLAIGFQEGIAWRGKAGTTTWSDWKKIPFVDGTGATGTWGISISGNAATATQLASTGTTNQFYRGDRTWSDTLLGTLKITSNNNTLTIGSQSSSFCNIYNSANIVFMFNNRVCTTAGGLGSGSYPWSELYLRDGIYYTGTKATYRMLRFIDNTGDEYGNGISIGGGGATIIGGGESADVAAGQVSGGSEILYLCNDGDVNIFSNMQNGWDSRKTFTFNTSGNIIANGFGSDTSMTVHPSNSNELNFGGTNTSNTIYFGYRAIDSRPLPTTYVFGTGNGTATVKAASFVGNADTATMPLGFSSRGTGATWGNTTGTSFTTWNDSTGGSIDFRRDNPSSGKLSIKVDGRFYGNEGTNPAMLMNYTNSYWGMGTADGNASDWIRTTTVGIIPYQSGGLNGGHCSLGTSSWYFSSAYIDSTYVYNSHVYNNLYVSKNNTTGCGIVFSDDGDIVDLNNGYCSMRFSSGVDICSGKSGGSTALRLSSNGSITSYRGTGDTGANENGCVLKVGANNWSNTGIFNGNGDGSGSGTANLIIKSWYGVGFVDGCSGNGMRASVDCRTGEINCYRVTANLGGSERRVGVDQGTSGTLYLFSNGNGKGIYSSSGYATGYVIRINSGGITHYGTVSSSSSKEVKTNIQYLNNTDYIDELKPVSFIYKKDEKKKTHFGLIYEDTIGILPNICTIPEEEDEPKGINYIELVPVLLKEIQNLRKRIKSLEDNK